MQKAIKLLRQRRNGGHQWEWYPTTSAMGLYGRTSGAYRIYVTNNGDVRMGTSSSNYRNVYARDYYIASSGKWASQLGGGRLSESNCKWYGTGLTDREDNDQWHSVTCPAGYYARGWRGYVTDYVDYSIAIYCCKLSIT